MIEPGWIVAGWPMVLSMASAVAVQALWAGRRRLALNRALHELRRPLQVVALAAGPEPAGAGRDAIELATEALERLDREINGGSRGPAWGVVDAGPLVRAAIARGQGRAGLAGASLELRWNAGEASVSGDRFALGQALDNLIANAIEHGGPTIVVAVRRSRGRLRIAVIDSGRAARPRSRQPSAAAVAARLAGKRRHGHGLAVVRRVVADHRGRFGLRHSEQGSLAVVELPLAELEPTRAA